MTDKDRDAEEKIKHRVLIQHINALLTTVSGREFIKYLFLNFGVGELPAPLTTGERLIEEVAFHRCGLSIFKVISEANPYMAGTMLAELESEKNNENLIQDTITENEPSSI